MTIVRPIRVWCRHRWLVTQPATGLKTMILSQGRCQLGDQSVAFLNRALDTRSPSRTTL